MKGTQEAVLMGCYILKKKKRNIDFQILITKLVIMIHATKYQDAMGRGILGIYLKRSQAYV